MNFNIQPLLENNIVALLPLEEKDFEALYQTASDPEIWAQHPNKNRWQKEVFKVFFEGAMLSRGAFKIIDKSSGEIIGSTRFYDHNPQYNSILIGYTFFKKAYWGRGYNTTVKSMMLDYIFQFANTVYFHIGAENIRSQKSINRIGAKKIAEETIPYFGEQPKLNFVYRIDKSNWGFL